MGMIEPRRANWFLSVLAIVAAVVKVYDVWFSKSLA